MNSDAAIITAVDARQVREAVIDLRCASLRSLALCRDIIDRLGEAWLRRIERVDAALAARIGCAVGVGLDRSKDGVLKCPSANLHAIAFAALNTARLSVDHLKFLIEYWPI